MNYMQKQNNRKVGTKYEQFAQKYLIEKNYKILETNFKIRTGEIDIIAKDNEYFVFFEVKYRTRQIYGLPKEAVTRAKQKNIISVAKYYLFSRKLDVFCRFDVIEIFGDESINHIENAFWEA
ncbi:YraN family protein [Candidatus Epulonipiscioides gigas]|nr:YraN family protein [Epulopiscium sp. SCG-C07WGA-EpuloA2]